MACMLFLAENTGKFFSLFLYHTDLVDSFGFVDQK